MINQLRVVGEFLRYSWYRLLIAFLCVGLAGARIIWPEMKVDWVTVVLIIIAALSLIAPNKEEFLTNAMKVLPYIKKAKVAGVEVELNDEIKKLAQNVDEVQEKIVSSESINITESFSDDQFEILREINDPKASLLLLAAKIEHQVSIQLEKHDLHKRDEIMPIRRAIDLGVRHGVFPQEIVDPFREFWAIRNRVAHGLAFDVDNKLIFSLISVGLNILRLVSMEKTDGPVSTE